MDNSLTLKKHNFDDKKRKIRELAHKVPETVSFREFQTSGSIIPWNDHNVTGKEINERLVSPLQDTLIAQNTGIIDLFNKINNIVDVVYETFDCLDKEYIEGIVISVKAAELASNQAKSASEKAYNASQQALTASNKANEAQADIKKTINALKETVATLKTFKEGVSTQIDSISSNLNAKTNVIKEELEGVIEDLRKQISETNSINEKKFKWAYAIAGTSFLTNLVLVILYACGVI